MAEKLWQIERKDGQPLDSQRPTHIFVVEHSTWYAARLLVLSWLCEHLQLSLSPQAVTLSSISEMPEGATVIKKEPPNDPHRVRRRRSKG